jgi:hypothetical protein
MKHIRCTTIQAETVPRKAATLLVTEQKMAVAESFATAVSILASAFNTTATALNTLAHK